jgi:hypothetical protein
MIAAAAQRLLDISVLHKVMDYRKQQKKMLTKDLRSFVADGRSEPDNVNRMTILAKSLRHKLGLTMSGLLDLAQPVALLDKDGQSWKKRRVLVASLVVFLFWVGLGTVVNGSLPDDLPLGGGSPLVKGFYFSVITLTTVGFGDYVPKTTAGKVFDVFYILIGVPISLNALGSMVSYIWAQDESQSVDLVEGLNQKKLLTMLEFQHDMFNAGCNNEVDDEVSRFEFMMFVLVRNGIVEMDTIEAIMKNFDELDIRQTNTLGVQDFQAGPQPEEDDSTSST